MMRRIFAHSNRITSVISRPTCTHHQSRLYSSIPPAPKYDLFSHKWKAAILIAVPGIYAIYKTQTTAPPAKAEQPVPPSDEDIYNSLCLPQFSGDVAGDAKTIKSRVLEQGANTLQNFGPVNSIHQHLCAVHFYNGDINRQVIAHHYCTHLNEDVHQCVIFDSDKPNSRLIGVEYIITEKLFKTLPEDEKKLWHSHHYEIKSGQLTLPRIPTTVENMAMTDLVNTYGKTWHFWQVDKEHPLPYGPPQLMMSFTADGQISPAISAALDKQTITSTIADRKKSRENMKYNTPDAGANSWESGPVVQVELVTKDTGKDY
eukprot:TRINITY_DN15174_c0_g1_i1.p1 TRINITY_DN15174_c0_g1~~TRINITY_DN15174_c0_g1_i1.p1  ORF type:complete len:316 (+),score=72.44 TRINITY_DN15174_c0_g1_i1:94-1041(+)